MLFNNSEIDEIDEVTELHVRERKPHYYINKFFQQISEILFLKNF